MKFKHLFFIVLSASLLGACATKSNKTSEAPSADQSAKVVGEIVGKPAPGSKFSKLKIGMTSKQVVALIGAPTKEWTHPTGKSAIPFYFGPDRWALQYSYKGEGVLTMNEGEEQFLTRIEVNTKE